MYLIYSTLYYIITLGPATGYVLLAANIEDFRILARRLVPDHLTHLADDIIDIAKDVVLEGTFRQDSADFGQQNSDTSTKFVDWVVDSQEREHKSPKKTKKHRKHKHTTENTTPVLAFNIDTLVEKVKQKLKDEFQLIPNKNNNKHNESSNLDEKKDEDTVKGKHDKIARNKNHKTNSGTTPNTKIGDETTPITKIDDENSKQKKKKRKPIDKRYVADAFYAHPPKYMLEQDKSTQPTTTKTTTTKKTHATYKEDPKYTTQGDESFVGIDIGNWNDSYDYVTPKKDADYKEDVETTERNKKKDYKGHVTDKRNVYDNSNLETTSRKPEKKNNKYSNKQQHILHSEKDLNVFSDEITTNKKRDEDYNDEKESYNHKENTVRVNKVTPTYVDDKKDNKGHYVTDKRNVYDNSNLETTSRKPEKKANKYSNKQRIVHSEKDLNVFSDEITTNKKRDEEYIDEKEPHNHKENPVGINKVTPTYVDDNETIKPYSKQLASIENNNEKVAKKRPTDEVVTSKVVQKPDVYKKRIKKNPIKNTIIPKRDFYKISSPNYLLKQPILGEKYHFDEPIPEDDRDPENLKYIGNPPASINGKVDFT